jgi:hypothetical protein
MGFHMRHLVLEDLLSELLGPFGCWDCGNAGEEQTDVSQQHSEGVRIVDDEDQ